MALGTLLTAQFLAFHPSSHSKGIHAGRVSESEMANWTRSTFNRTLSDTLAYSFPKGFNIHADAETLIFITGTLKRPSDDWRADRISFIGRHLAQMKRLEEMNAARCSSTLSCRQFIWILAEDSDHIDVELESLLKCAQIPFIYFAYGPTRNYGNAQKNALLQFVADLTRSFKFYANVHPIDDDGYGLAEGYELCYGIKKFGLLPIVAVGLPEDMEYAAIENGKVVIHGGWPERAFPFDYNMMIFNSSLFDKFDADMSLFWPYPGRGGESEFAERHLDSIQEIEVPCHKCQYLFYNLPIEPDHTIFRC
ncbi:Galactosylgalactosylxylosylprotein 3-beta-glucuronosyltransferase 2 [Rhizoclosmatium sp. JEL0117]|nr:Galactosylgalactosylxylosylprotein 3-beta-glucuronosyltransferase 2 [Rhizoclosmatium sp. JEL0117]